MGGGSRVYAGFKVEEEEEALELNLSAFRVQMVAGEIKSFKLEFTLGLTCQLGFHDSNGPFSIW